MGLDPASAAKASASLAPGFRFHPTDEELVGYYLKRKLCGKPFRFDAISEIDIYKSEPWDLPGKSKLKSRDLEWYFFSALDKKYGNGWRTNRATNRGYWKTTGKDRAVFHKSRTIGMKKTLVFHSGRAPKGERTNWVMHEYKLVDEELEKIGIVQEDAFVLCRIFHKSGSGPKNGEQYGAPLVEDEWDDEKLVMVPGEECAEEVAFGEDACLDGNDLEQILEADFISEDVPLPLSFYYEDNSNHVQEPEEFADDDQKFLVGMDEIYRIPELPDGQNLFDLPVENDMYTKPVRHEYIGEPSNTVDSVDADYLLDSPFLDAIDNTQFDGAFLETNDLSNPVEADTSRFGMLEEDYLTFFDTDVNNSQYMPFDSSKMMGNVKLDSDKASLIQKTVDGGAQQEPNNDFASTSKQEPANLESDVQYPFIKQASCMLGGIPDPFVFSSDFPSKDAMLRSNSTSRSSNSIHVTAGMIQIQNMTLSGNGKYCSLGKHTNISIILSFGVSQTDGSSASLALMADILLGKPNSAILWGWFYLILISVLILITSFKMGNCIYTGNAS